MSMYALCMRVSYACDIQSDLVLLFESFKFFERKIVFLIKNKYSNHVIKRPGNHH